MWEYNYICHHGIKGQRWGVRRYQNEDGSLNEDGKKRYAKMISKANKYNKKYHKYTAKSEKVKASIPSRYFTEIGRATTEKRVVKANRYEGKALRYLKKSHKLDAKIAKLSRNNINIGENYVRQKYLEDLKR